MPSWRGRRFSPWTLNVWLWEKAMRRAIECLAPMRWWMAMVIVSKGHWSSHPERQLGEWWPIFGDFLGVQSFKIKANAYQNEVAVGCIQIRFKHIFIWFIYLSISSYFRCISVSPLSLKRFCQRHQFSCDHEVVSYLTPFTGLRPGDLDGQRALSLDRARRELQQLLPRRDFWAPKMLICHAIYHPKCCLKYVGSGANMAKLGNFDWLMRGKRGLLAKKRDPLACVWKWIFPSLEF